jgi:unsaturated chondroitin disaccharide hydrolase
LLGTAKKVADYFIDNLPADFITYWDFNAPDIPNYDRDTSAASIAASGLLELSILVPEIQNKQKYYNAAREILISLCSNYSNGGYLAQDNIGVPLSRGLLLEGCYHHPLGQTGYTRLHESLIWGDYYFIEAMLRYQSIDAP